MTEINETFYSKDGRPPRYEVRCSKCDSLLFSLILTEQSIVDVQAQCRKCDDVGAIMKGLRLEKYFVDSVKNK